MKQCPIPMLMILLASTACHELHETPDDAAQRALDEDVACGELATPILAGQDVDVGQVSLREEDGGVGLRVRSDASEGWAFERLHIYVGTERLPEDSSGPAPGQFPIIVDFSEPTTVYTDSISFEQAGAGCGDTVTVAVHGEFVQLDATGSVVRAETGWALGEPFEGSARWGWSLEFGLCCEVVEEPEPEPDPTEEPPADDPSPSEPTEPTEPTEPAPEHEDCE